MTSPTPATHHTSLSTQSQPPATRSIHVPTSCYQEHIYMCPPPATRSIHVPTSCYQEHTCAHLLLPGAYMSPPPATRSIHVHLLLPGAYMCPPPATRSIHEPTSCYQEHTCAHLLLPGAYMSYTHTHTRARMYVL
jgi:hypothetical protein